MTVLEDLKANLVDGHQVTIAPISDFYKSENKKRDDIKEAYVIQIYHPDQPAGIFFSRYASHYQKIVTKILDEHSNGKMYESCCSECGNLLEFDITWNRNRVLQKA